MAVFRLIAIDEPWQGHGLGTIMLDMAEMCARRLGVDKICLNSVSGAYGFYARCGFMPSHWDGCTHNDTEIPVMKLLAAPPLRGFRKGSRDSRPHTRPILPALPL